MLKLSLKEIWSESLELGAKHRSRDMQGNGLQEVHADRPKKHLNVLFAHILHSLGGGGEEMDPHALF